MAHRVLCGFLGGSAGKESACNARDLGSIPELERSPGEGEGYPLQYSGLENSMEYKVHGVTKNRTCLSYFPFPFQSTKVFGIHMGILYQQPWKALALALDQFTFFNSNYCF